MVSWTDVATTDDYATGVLQPLNDRDTSAAKMFDSTADTDIKTDSKRLDTSAGILQFFNATWQDVLLELRQKNDAALQWRNNADSAYIDVLNVNTSDGIEALTSQWQFTNGILTDADLQFSQNAFKIVADTDDTLFCGIAGGTNAAAGNSGYLLAFGNDNGFAPGLALLNAGNVSGGQVTLSTTGTQPITVQTNSIGRANYLDSGIYEFSGGASVFNTAHHKEIVDDVSIATTSVTDILNFTVPDDTAMIIEILSVGARVGVADAGTYLREVVVLRRFGGGNITEIVAETTGANWGASDLTLGNAAGTTVYRVQCVLGTPTGTYACAAHARILEVSQV